MFGLGGGGRLAGQWSEKSLQQSVSNRLGAEEQAMAQQGMVKNMMEQEQTLRQQKGLSPLPSDLSADDWLRAQKPQKSLLGRIGDVAMFPINNPIGQMALFMGAPYAIDALTPKPDPVAQMQAASFDPKSSEAQKQMMYQQMAMQAGGMAR
jgi:hypothetical protein